MKLIFTRKTKYTGFITVAGLLALLFLWSSCSQPSSPNTGGTTLPGIDPNEAIVENALNKAAVEPSVIIGSGKKITLSGADLTWTSNDTTVINVSAAPSGEYDVMPAEKKTEVVLTAKAVKGSITKTRMFTVLVYKDSSQLTAADLLKSINLPSETEKDIALPPSITDVSGASITWTSDKENVIAHDGKINPAARDLQNKAVKLTATLTYNGGTATKKFTVALKRLTKIEVTYTADSTTWEFIGDKIRYTRMTNSGGTVEKYGFGFVYTDLDMEAKTFTVSKTHVMNSVLDGIWYELGSQEFKNALLQAAKPNNRENILKNYAGWMKEARKPLRYEYTISYNEYLKKYHFQARRPYDSNTHWFDQAGLYFYYNDSTKDSIRFYKKYTSSYVFEHNRKEYKGSLNEEGTLFTGKIDGEADEKKITITDNKNKTISITVDGNSYTLNFRGDDLVR
ncbi:MAG: immunoglobulin-like domain-containing protein [Treponema sp.]